MFRLRPFHRPRSGPLRGNSPRHAFDGYISDAEIQSSAAHFQLIRHTYVEYALPAMNVLDDPVITLPIFMEAWMHGFLQMAIITQARSPQACCVPLLTTVSGGDVLL